MIKQNANFLKAETSPYLQQHATNPVAWRPWNEKSLSFAQKENKLMIISIGYSACHWCHVMEKESFMDEGVAEIMNTHFLSIKVDREERPDVDQVYMQSAYLITGSGGWPLNVIALPDGRPVYAGTYFPKEKWKQILEYFATIFNSNPALLNDQAENILSGMRESIKVPPGSDETIFGRKEIQGVSKAILSRIDMDSGGLSGAPKFPMPSVFDFLLHYHYLTNDKNALDVVNVTLKKMAAGGVYDQLGGGFCRYSTDTQWMAPHFEKMLYDNGQLLGLYARAYRLTSDPEYKWVVESTIDFVKRDLLSPEGGFYAALDADSEGEEGLFYTWTKTEIIDTLGQGQEDFCDFYQIKEGGNWEKGRNILWRETIAKTDFLLSPRFISLRENLLKEREKRTKPGLDNKIICSWNALMLKGLLEAYGALNEPDILLMALNNAEFLLVNMIEEGGRVLRFPAQHKARINGFLDDYAYLADAFINLYRYTFEEKWLYHASEITNYALKNFYNAEEKLFHYTSLDDVELIIRPVEYSDNVMPSAVSVMMSNLWYLDKYFQIGDFKNIYKHSLKRIYPSLIKNPLFHTAWAKLTLSDAYPQQELVIIGPKAEALRQELEMHYLPGIVVSGGEKSGTLSLFEYKYIEGRSLIYICRDKHCLEPVESTEQALSLINERK